MWLYKLTMAPMNSIVHRLYQTQICFPLKSDGNTYWNSFVLLDMAQLEWKDLDTRHHRTKVRFVSTYECEHATNMNVLLDRGEMEKIGTALPLRYHT